MSDQKLSNVAHKISTILGKVAATRMAESHAALDTAQLAANTQDFAFVVAELEPQQIEAVMLSFTKTLLEDKPRQTD